MSIEIVLKLLPVGLTPNSSPVGVPVASPRITIRLPDVQTSLIVQCRSGIIFPNPFPGQIPDRLVIAEELKGNIIDLEGNELVAVELGHTDTDHTTCLNVPSIGLVVAGDAAYNDVHLYLAESNAKTRQEWISALDKIGSLNPRAVVASHKRPGNDDNPRIIEETRQYIRDFDRIAEMTTTAQELYDNMLKLYPNRVNQGWALWSSARAVKS